MTYPPPDSPSDWGTPPEPSGSQQGRTDPTAGNDDRVIAVLAHLSPLIAAIVSFGALSFLGPLILWFVYKDRNALVRNAAASSFNFHITIWICWVLALIFFLTVVGIPIAILLWVVPAIAQLVFSIVGALRAWSGELYSYPFQIPILRS